ncbi:MAG: hypothetical protein DRI61_05515 [Chloroflexi bacterium]|nr:MAG: hypothetical protein DRI61_05515 [Chloroflexota bacterium]
MLPHSEGKKGKRGVSVGNGFAVAHKYTSPIRLRRGGKGNTPLETAQLVWRGIKRWSRAMAEIDRGFVVNQLKRLKLFSRLSDEELNALAKIVKSDRILKDTPIVRQGEMKPVLYIIVAGEAVAHSVDEQGRERPVRYLREGEAFGETSLLVGEPRDATVIATTDMDVLYITKAEFDEFLAQYRKVRKKLQVSPQVRKILKASKFNWLVEGEAVIWLGHRHWYILLTQLPLPLTLLLLLLLLGRRLKALTSPLFLLLLILVLGWIGLRILNWRLDRFVLTNRRVLYLEIYPYQLVPTMQAPLERIQDVYINIPFPMSVFNAGNLVISTAGKLPGQIIFDRVSHPDRIREQILSQKARRLRWERAEERSRIRGLITGRFRPPPPLPPTLAPRPRIPPFIRWFVTEIREEDRVIWRTHYFILIKRIFLPSVLLLLLGYILIRTHSLRLLYGPIGLLILLLGLWFVVRAIDWANEQYIVTPREVIEIKITPIFPLIPPVSIFRRIRKRVAPLGSIQDITTKIGYLQPEETGRAPQQPPPPGQRESRLAILIRTMRKIARPILIQTTTLIYMALGIGHVILETAAPTGRFIFENVGNPFKIQGILFDYIQRFYELEKQEMRRDVERLVEDWMWVHKEIDHGKVP